MPSIAQLNAEIEKIKARNKKVESDKAWETSAVRNVVIAVLTYVVIALFMLVSKIPDPFTNAVVPTAGFVLSTKTLVDEEPH